MVTVEIEQGLQESIANAEESIQTGDIKHDIKIRQAQPDDVDGIAHLVQDEAKKGTVLDVEPEDVAEWVANGKSFVAVLDGKVIGHVGAYTWPGCRWTELRSNVVAEEYRKHFIYRNMLNTLISEIFSSNQDTTVVMLKNELSMGKGLLAPFGFSELENGVPEELFEIGSEQHWTVYCLRNEDYTHSEMSELLRQ